GAVLRPTGAAMRAWRLGPVVVLVVKRHAQLRRERTRRTRRGVEQPPLPVLIIARELSVRRPRGRAAELAALLFQRQPPRARAGIDQIDVRITAVVIAHRTIRPIVEAEHAR